VKTATHDRAFRCAAGAIAIAGSALGGVAGGIAGGITGGVSASGGATTWVDKL